MVKAKEREDPNLEDWRQEVRARMEEEHQTMTACGGMGANNGREISIV